MCQHVPRLHDIVVNAVGVQFPRVLQRVKVVVNGARTDVVLADDSGVDLRVT